MLRFNTNNEGNKQYARAYIQENLVVLRKTGKKRHVFGPNSGQKPMKEQS